MFLRNIGNYQAARSTSQKTVNYGNIKLIIIKFKGNQAEYNQGANELLR
jgi:hypothetical protein